MNRSVRFLGLILWARIRRARTLKGEQRCASANVSSAGRSLAAGNPLFAQIAVQAFRDARADVSSIQDISATDWARTPCDLFHSRQNGLTLVSMGEGKLLKRENG
jgi:hypothetical protein